MAEPTAPSPVASHIVDSVLDDGWGVALLALLIVLQVALLPRRDRRRFVGPLLLLVLAIGLLAARALAPEQSGLARFLEFAALLFLLVGIGRSGFLIVFRGVLSRFQEPWPKIFLDIVQSFIYVAALVVALAVGGVNLPSLLTGSAVLGVVLGLALQDTLGNLFAGLAIQVQLPFEVGDWIQFDPALNRIGKVIEINWRATKIVTLDEVELIIPNATLGKAQIANYTKPTNVSRRSVYVHAPYDVPPQRVNRIILKAIGDAWGVLSQPPPSVVTNAFDERGVQYWVRFFTTEFGKRDLVDGGVRDRIWYALQRHGIAIPPPAQAITWTRNVHDGAAAARGRLAEREEALRCVDLFRLLSPEHLAQLARRAQSRLFAPGEAIVKQGDAGAELFVLVRGHVCITVDQDDGQQLQAGELGPGSFFGEMSLMTGAPRTATAAAIGECELLVVDKLAFREVLEATPHLSERISQIMAERLARQAKLNGDARDRRGQDEPEVSFAGLLGRIKQFFALRD